MPHAIQIRQTGGPEVLNWTTVDVGEPGSGQVRLHQAAGCKHTILYSKQDFVRGGFSDLRRRETAGGL